MARPRPAPRPPAAPLRVALLAALLAALLVPLAAPARPAAAQDGAPWRRETGVVAAGAQAAQAVRAAAATLLAFAAPEASQKRPFLRRPSLR